MGKKRQGGKRKQQNHGGGKNGPKRKKQEKYWIEDCRETKGVEPKDTELHVLITRVELTDKHTHHTREESAGGISAENKEAEGNKILCEEAARPAGTVGTTKETEENMIPAEEAAKTTVSAETKETEDMKMAAEETTRTDRTEKTINILDKGTDGAEFTEERKVDETKETEEEKIASKETASPAGTEKTINRFDNETDENRLSEEKKEQEPNKNQVAAKPCRETSLGGSTAAQGQNEATGEKSSSTDAAKIDENAAHIDSAGAENSPGSSEKAAASQPRDQTIKAVSPGASKHEDFCTMKDGGKTDASVAKKQANTLICVRRDASAKRKLKKFAYQNFRPLANGDCGDGIQNPFPKHVVDDKYWAQRHRLFSRFDEGIELDRESWYSVTPEAIADHIAQKVVQQAVDTEGLVVVDAFCGAGGNAIAFAKRPGVALVVCVDLDEEKLRLAAHNSKVYDVPDNKLLFLHGDACDVLQQYKHGQLLSEPTDPVTQCPTLVHGYKLGGMDSLPKKIGAVFLSPPWGGVDYEKIGPRKYDLKCIELVDDVDGEQLLEYASHAVPSVSGGVTCFLPRNTNGIAVGKSALKAGISGKMEMEQNFLNHKFKSITIYMPGSSKRMEAVSSEATQDLEL